MGIVDLLRKICGDVDVATVVTTPASDGPPVILAVNPAFCTMTGYSPAELVGQTPRMLQGRKTSGAAAKRLVMAMRHRRDHTCVLTNYRKDGTPYLCSVEAHPIVGASGEVICCIAFEREVVRKRGRPARGQRFDAPANEVA